MDSAAPITGSSARAADAAVNLKWPKQRLNGALLSGQMAILEMIAKGNPLAHILDALCKLVEQTSAGSLCSILLLDVSTNSLWHVASPSLPQSYIEKMDRRPVGPSAGSCGRAAHYAEQVIVADIAADPLWADCRHVPLSYGLKACWSTPILSQLGNVLGVFAIHSPKRGDPSRHQLRLIEQFTYLASIAIERKQAEEANHRNEESLRETKAALEFTLESAQVGEWDLDLINDTSRRSFRHDQCFGYNTPIPEADWGIAVFIQHVHPEDRVHVDGSLRRAIKELLDWSAEFRVVWPDGSVHWLAARGSNYRTSEGRATRMLGIVMDITERKRTDEALRASEQLARGQVEALTRTLDALAMESDPDRLVRHILGTITDLFGAHSSSVWRRDEASGTIGIEFAFEGGRVVPKTDPRFTRMDLWLPIGEFWPWSEVFRTGKPSVIEDIRTVQQFALRDRLLPLGIVTVLLVPMSIAGRLEGAIGLRFTHKRAFRSEEIELAQALTNQAMLAMQLTYLYGQSRESAVIAERNRMARDIHDTLAQGLTGVIVQLEAAGEAISRNVADKVIEHLDRAADLARESLQEARNSVGGLRSQALEDNDLCEALNGLIKKMTAGTPVAAEFVCRGELCGMPAEWEENLLRIGQEALTNVLRHADATKLEVQLIFNRRQMQLTLRDNGCGFDTERRHDGFGLQGMRERAEDMGGQLTIQSGRRQGTFITIVLPIASAVESRIS